VDAQFASAKSQSVAQESAAREAQHGVADLQQEAERNANAPATNP